MRECEIVDVIVVRRPAHALGFQVRQFYLVVVDELLPAVIAGRIPSEQDVFPPPEFGPGADFSIASRVVRIFDNLNRYLEAPDGPDASRMARTGERVMERTEFAGAEAAECHTITGFGFFWPSFHQAKVKAATNMRRSAASSLNS
jgi:hypothetical protein